MKHNRKFGNYIAYIFLCFIDDKLYDIRMKIDGNGKSIKMEKGKGSKKCEAWGNSEIG